jgi:aldehyde dehydrogenase (NAD+)
MEGQAVREYGAFINGAFRAMGTSTFEARNAASGALLATLSRCGPTEIDDAVEAARRAFPAWANLTAEERSAKILQFAALVEDQAEELAQLASWHRDTWSRSECHWAYVDRSFPGTIPW